MAQTAKNLEPQGELISISEIAKRCGIHRQTCTTRLDDLGYEPDESSTAKNKIYLFTDAMKFEIKAARDEMAAMKIREMRASAQLKELKLAEARGELVPIAEAVELIQSIIAEINQELTVRQGKRIDPKLVKAKTLVDVKRLRNADNALIMKRLRANFQQFIGIGS